ncbi:MAG: hypothetical protein V3U10_06185 [Bacteroidota bacterium]
MVRGLHWVCILSLVLLMKCDRRPSLPEGWDRLGYFPLVPGATWTFSGPFGRVVLSDSSTQAGRYREGASSEFRLDFVDGSPSPRLQEVFVVSGDQIYWRDFKLPYLPLITFDPPLPVLPPSSRAGDSLVVDSNEQWRDSVETSFAIRGVLTVVGVEDVSVPAGDFKDCIRVRQAILYEDLSVPHLFTWIELWYAKGIGWVQYVSEAGSGELVSAMVGDMRYP